MTISFELNDLQSALASEYFGDNQAELSELARNSFLEKLEDELDLAAYEEAMEEYRKNPVTYSLDEVKEELGL